jgi:hypothetical protein
MLLPSAHAAAAVELVPDDRVGNLAQSILPRGDGLQDVLFRYRFLPASSSPSTVAATIGEVIAERPGASVTFGRRWTNHELLSRDPDALRRARNIGEM